MQKIQPAKSVLQFQQLPLEMLYKNDEPEDLVFRFVSIDTLMKEINTILDSPYLTPEHPYKWSIYDDNQEFRRSISEIFLEFDDFDFLSNPEYLSSIFHDLPDTRKSAVLYRLKIALMNVKNLLQYEDLHFFFPTQWNYRMHHIVLGYLPVFYFGIQSY